MKIQVTVSASHSAQQEVLINQLREQLSVIPEVTLNSGDEQTPGRIARSVELEIIATILSSAAAVQLSLALRDFVRKKRIKLAMRRPDGSELAIEGAGDVQLERISAFLDEKRETLDIHMGKENGTTDGTKDAGNHLDKHRSK